MEQIKVSDFLSIKSANVEIKKLNIVIGPQASGKSIIAKLVYFFESMLQESIPDAVKSLSGKRDLDKSIAKRFEEIFPRHTWDGTSFKIEYVYDQVEVIIHGDASKKRTNLKIQYSNNIYNIFNRMKAKYQQVLIAAKDQKTTGMFGTIESRAFQITVKEILSNSSFQKSFSTPLFIPASRSFFANLQKNIFSFLASNIEIDPFLKDFGSLYENSKFMHRSNIFSNVNRGDELRTAHKTLSKISNDIVNGEYEYHEEQDWIIQRGRRTNLANASSGQQESLPMLLVLTFSPLFRDPSLNDSHMIFIEEPEAHLFPYAQKLVVSALSVLQHELGTKFFITTHSPYILSALNNLMYAHEIESKSDKKTKKIRKAISPSKPIDSSEISAFTISNGVSTSIINKNENLISTDFIDSTSEAIEVEFNNLMSVEYDLET